MNKVSQLGKIRDGSSTPCQPVMGWVPLYKKWYARATTGILFQLSSAASALAHEVQRRAKAGTAIQGGPRRSDQGAVGPVAASLTSGEAATTNIIQIIVAVPLPAMVAATCTATAPSCARF